MVGAVKPGLASRKLWCLKCLLKTGNVKAEETWIGSLFQKRDAVDENDFEVVIDVFLNGADMVIEEEDWSDREGELGEFDQGIKAAGSAAPWKQL